MGLQPQCRELSDMGRVKSLEQAVDMTGNSDRDELDREQLARLGKKSVLKRNFRFLAILGFNCTILVTWEGVLMNLRPGLNNGGPAGIIYGFIFVWIGNLSVFSTLSELVSIAPTSGGQYHWVAMLAPRSCSKFLSYLAGWLTLAGWQGTCASAGFLTGTMLQGLVTFLVPSFDAQKWQGTLMLFMCVFIVVMINTVVSSMLPKLEGMILVLHILGFFTVLISLVTFGAHGDAQHVFLQFNNDGNWPSQILSTFVGLLGCVFAFVDKRSESLQSPVDERVLSEGKQMCEEVRNPSLVVPRSIMTSIMINGCMGLIMAIAMLYGITDINKALASPTSYPYIEIFYQATGSKPGTAAMTALIIVMTLSAIVGVIAASSRMFWAFARDRGLPCWRTLSKVGRWTNVPVWAIGTTSAISCILGLINLGSSVVYEALVSVAVSGLYASYLMAAALLFYRRCGKGFKLPDPSVLPALADTTTGDNKTLAWGPWHVPGVFGIINNSYACVYMLFILFFSFWSPVSQPALDSINMSPAMTGAVVLFSVVYYLLWAKHEYKGPIMEANAD